MWNDNRVLIFISYVTQYQIYACLPKHAQSPPFDQITYSLTGTRDVSSWEISPGSQWTTMDQILGLNLNSTSTEYLPGMDCVQVVASTVPHMSAP